MFQLQMRRNGPRFGNDGKDGGAGGAMRSIVVGITAACLVLPCSAALAEPSRTDESQKWVPSLGLTSGILVGGARGDVSSSVRPSAGGSESLISPWIGASLEIMTPAWEPLGGRTRFFAHGGVAANVGFDRDLAKEGAPAKFVAPTLPPINSDAVVQGQGSVTSTQPAGFQASAGAGVSFTIETGWRRLRIKPSFEYLVEEIEVDGLVHRATLLDPNVPSFNFISISGSQTEFFHSIGPGLEIEADIARGGPVLVALLVSGSAVHILGDRDVDFSSTDATGLDTATWGYRKDAWTYRAHVGVRFRWVPEAGF